MSRFPIQWMGNKRAETPRIVPHIPATTSVVCEPFAGSAAVSMEYYTRYPGRATRFILNDTDPGLIQLYKAVWVRGIDSLNEWVRQRLNADDWLAIRKAGDTDVNTWYYNRKVLTGRFDPKAKPPKRWPTLTVTDRQREGEAFIQNAELDVTNVDWLACARTVMDDPNAVIYLDPPYFSSFNQNYYGFSRPTTADGKVIDGTQIFIDIKQFMDQAAATVILSTNSVAILRNLYSPYVADIYDHQYANLFRTVGSESYVRKQGAHLLAIKHARHPLTDRELEELLGVYGWL